jgi:hypothetical protein
MEFTTRHGTLDVYALTRHRDAATIQHFLDAYIDQAANEDRGDEELLLDALPTASAESQPSAASEWEPAVSLSHSVQRGLDYPRRAFTLYLQPKDPSFDRAMLGFTGDDQLVVGLSISDDGLAATEPRARQLLDKLAHHYDGYLGAVLLNEYPPHSEAAFRAKAARPSGTLYYIEFHPEPKSTPE